jgi:hypothetical protein
LKIFFQIFLNRNPKEIMEAPKETQIICQGVTSDGQACKRGQSSSAGNGFCYQHQSQGILQQQEVVLEQLEQDSMEMDIDEEDEDHQDEEDEEDEDEGHQQEEEEETLTRCTAITSTTKLRCKKLVSLAGETLCPAHGGQQLRAKLNLAMCQAQSKTTRQPCKKHVNFAGERFCSHHGGRKVNDAAPPAIVVTNQPAATLTLPKEEPVWNALNQASMTFLLVTHQEQGCKCTLSHPCKGMALVHWVQLLIKLAQDNVSLVPSTTLSSILSVKNPSVFILLTPGHNTNNSPSCTLFGDMYLAVEIFGPAIYFLPKLFAHMQTLLPSRHLQPNASNQQGNQHANDKETTPPFSNIEQPRRRKKHSFVFPSLLSTGGTRGGNSNLPEPDAAEDEIF